MTQETSERELFDETYSWVKEAYGRTFCPYCRSDRTINTQGGRHTRSHQARTVPDVWAGDRRERASYR